jgi:hypothetical protein
MLFLPKSMMDEANIDLNSIVCSIFSTRLNRAACAKGAVKLHRNADYLMQ